MNVQKGFLLDQIASACPKPRTMRCSIMAGGGGLRLSQVAANLTVLRCNSGTLRRFAWTPPPDRRRRLRLRLPWGLLSWRHCCRLLHGRWRRPRWRGFLQWCSRRRGALGWLWQWFRERRRTGGGGRPCTPCSLPGLAADVDEDIHCVYSMVCIASPVNVQSREVEKLSFIDIL